jgi:hypothetical protein
VGFTILVGFVASIVAVNVLRQVSFNELTPNDDYDAVVRKLGQPAEEHWQSETGAQFRSLWYPQRASFVLLMGDARRTARYIGVMDANWNPIHWVPVPAGGSTESTLRGLKKF